MIIESIFNFLFKKKNIEQADGRYVACKTGKAVNKGNLSTAILIISEHLCCTRLLKYRKITKKRRQEKFKQNVMW